MHAADDLRNLEPECVSVTTAVDADETFCPVGGLWAKFGQQVMDLAHRHSRRPLSRQR